MLSKVVIVLTFVAAIQALRLAPCKFPDAAEQAACECRNRCYSKYWSECNKPGSNQELCAKNQEKCLLNCAPKKCTRPVDVSFIIDSSGSISTRGSPSEWKTELDAVKTVANGLASGSRVSALQFSSDRSTKLEIDWMSVNGFGAKVDQINKISGSTYLETASKINLAQLKKVSGHRKVTILLTDGFIADLSKAEANIAEARKMGTVIAVGIGSNTNADQLKNLASKNHVFHADFTTLKALAEKLSKVACAPDPTTPRPTTKKPRTPKDPCCDRVFALCRRKGKRCNRRALLGCVKRLRCSLHRRLCEKIKVRCSKRKHCHGKYGETKDGKSVKCKEWRVCNKKRVRSKKRHCKLALRFCSRRVCRRVCVKVCKAKPTTGKPTTSKPTTQRPMYKRSSEAYKSEIPTGKCTLKCRNLCREMKAKAVKKKAVAKAKKAVAKKVEVKEVSKSAYDEASLDA